MSTKAIVFYTGKLQEAQENSLRQIHGIEDLIFVPIESVSDLETNLLETTERPFTVYNYLTNNSLVLALCDKLLNFTQQTGYEPEYFIWVDNTTTNNRKETIKMSTNKSRIVVITEETLSRSLRLSLDQVNDSIDVININIPATDEEHVKRVFDDKVFRGYTKPTFVLIDDRHKYADTICTLAKTMNVHGNINVKIIDMRDKSLNEIIKQQADLEVQERFETMKAAQLVSLEPKPFTQVTRGTSYLTSGVVLSDDVMFGSRFDASINCFIYTSSEKYLLPWFNTLIMNLAISKREFPMLKAVIYAFDDERNQPMLGDERDHQFVSRHIIAALELFGDMTGVKIFKANEVAEFMQCIALTPLEEEERAMLVVQAKQTDAIKIDANSFPPEVKRKAMEFMNKVKGQFLRVHTSNNDPKRPNPYLSYGEAIEMCKSGIDVTCVNWRAGEFLTVNTGSVVHADNFWSPGNKRTAMANADQSLSVFPHFLRTTKYGTIPHMVDFNDQFSEWVVASDRIKVKTYSVDGNKFTLHYALDTFSTAEFELAPFWMAYDVLADLPNNVTIITDNDANVLVHIIASMKEAHDNQRQIIEESFEIYDGRIPEEFPNRGITHYPISGLNNTIEAIRQGTFTHVIVDSDSFKTDFRLEAIKSALQEAKVNWASISVKEQLFGISE